MLHRNTFWTSTKKNEKFPTANWKLYAIHIQCENGYISSILKLFLLSMSLLVEYTVDSIVPFTAHHTWMFSFFDFWIIDIEFSREKLCLCMRIFAIISMNKCFHIKCWKKQMQQMILHRRVLLFFTIFAIKTSKSIENYFFKNRYLGLGTNNNNPIQNLKMCEKQGTRKAERKIHETAFHWKFFFFFVICEGFIPFSTLS